MSAFYTIIFAYFKIIPLVENVSNLFCLIPQNGNNQNWQKIDNEEISDYSFLKASLGITNNLDALNERVAHVNLDFVNSSTLTA
jgi:hypothetical protein